MLHAASIAFALPSGEIKTVEAPLPQLIGNFLATLGMSAPF
jgi:hypothetical protein